jgi:hypothetical protein
VRCGVGHAARSAGRAEPSHLAGKAHQPLAAAVVAAHAQEAVGEDSAGEKGAELARRGTPARAAVGELIPGEAGHIDVAAGDGGGSR